MATITATTFLSLDGVMQAPADPDEDRRGGFERGGWQRAYNDDVLGAAMGEGMAQGGAMLFGRRTYEHFASFWPSQPDDNPYARVLNGRQKYVVSRTLDDPLPWRNSTLLRGEAAASVPALKQQLSENLSVLGSADLVQSLMREDLIDEYVLLIHPLVLGSGRRLFADQGAFAELALVDSTVTTTGVLIARYRRASDDRDR